MIVSLKGSLAHNTGQRNSLSSFLQHMPVCTFKGGGGGGVNYFVMNAQLNIWIPFQRLYWFLTWINVWKQQLFSVSKSLWLLKKHKAKTYAVSFHLFIIKEQVIRI